MRAQRSLVSFLSPLRSAFFRPLPSVFTFHS